MRGLQAVFTVLSNTLRIKFNQHDQKAVCLVMGKFKNQNGEVILNLDNYIIGQANLTFESSDTLTRVVGFSKEVAKLGKRFLSEVSEFQQVSLVELY